MMYLGIKMIHTEDPVYQAFGLARRLAECVTRSFLKVAAASAHNMKHVQLKQVLHGIIFDQLCQFVQEHHGQWDIIWDETMFKELRAYLMKKRMMRSSERFIESPHARTSRAAKRTPRHSEPYVSVELKFPEIDFVW